MNRIKDFTNSLLCSAAAIIGGTLVVLVALVKLFWPGVIK